MRFPPPDRWDPLLPRFRGIVTAMFPAVHATACLPSGGAPLGSLPVRATAERTGRPHGHDFAATFVFEATELVDPGVVVDDDMHSEITHHIHDRLRDRDLSVLFGQPATCEVIATHLATWHRRSARVTGHAHLVSVTVTTAIGGHGEIRPPHPLTTRSRRR